MRARPAGIRGLSQRPAGRKARPNQSPARRSQPKAPPAQALKHVSPQPPGRQKIGSLARHLAGSAAQCPRHGEPHRPAAHRYEPPLLARSSLVGGRARKASLSPRPRGHRKPGQRSGLVRPERSRGPKGGSAARPQAAGRSGAAAHHADDAYRCGPPQEDGLPSTRALSADQR
jgi:hypothetical protein